jgi:2-oxoglutarate ferredoxin oxidoreductase subunit alpha
MGPQIRGGEAAALLRLAVHPVECLPDRFDLMIGIDWLNAHRFGAEIKAGPQTLVISDPRGGELPPMVTQSGARVVEVPMKEMAKAIPDGRPNMIALGIASRLLGFTVEQAFAPIEKRLVDKGSAAIEASLAGIKVGFGAAAGIDFGMHLAAPTPSPARRWLLSGNEATALGAIRGGIRFAAGHRSIRPVHGPVACRHRTARRRCVHRRARRRHRSCRPLQTSRHDSQRRISDGHSGNARRSIYG